MIQVDSLTKRYADKTAVQDVSFNVEKGEILGLLGPNGAGKTTTLRVLAGFMAPTSGSASIAGFDVVEQSRDARRHAGYMPETVPLYTDLTPRTYLTFMGKLKGIPAEQRKARVDDAVEKARIGDVADKIIGKLSKGYRQRVGLAQALLGDPDVLILDEPTIGLDPRQVTETRQLIKGFGGSHSVILSSHILPEVSVTCNRVVIISEGRVVAVDTPQNLTRRLQGAERLVVEVRGPADEVRVAIGGIPGVTHAELDPSSGEGSKEGLSLPYRYLVESELGVDIRERLASTVVQSGWGLLELRTAGMSLEEIFLQLTTREEVAV